jgi:glycosyltransferase involved in cell wall biosynthesis
VPTVFVGMPCYNSSRYLSKAIESILSQTFCDFRLVISDNKSTDNSFDIARYYSSMDPRIVAVQHTHNMGAAENFNYLLKQADSKYFMFAGSHDCWSDDYIEKLIVVLQSDEDVVLAFGSTVSIDQVGQAQSLDQTPAINCNEEIPIRRALKIVKSLHSCDMVYGVHKFATLKSCRTEMKCIGPDNVLLMEIALNGKIKFCADPIFFRREIRADPVDDDEFRAGQLERITGKKTKNKKFNFRYVVWLWQHMLSSLHGPGVFHRRVMNMFIIGYAFIIRWNQHLPFSVNCFFRLISPIVRRLPQ